MRRYASATSLMPHVTKRMHVNKGIARAATRVRMCVFVLFRVRNSSGQKKPWEDRRVPFTHQQFMQPPLTNHRPFVSQRIDQVQVPWLSAGCGGQAERGHVEPVRSRGHLDCLPKNQSAQAQAG
jgi:hypothetical protein